MNKYLTLEEKQSLVNMLQKHYTIEEEPFISNLAEDDEEKVELTLKAFSLVSRTQEAKAKLMIGKSTTSNSPYAIVQIDKLDAKLQLVKAIKDTTGWGLKECKDFVDTVVLFKRIAETGICEYTYEPFKVGPKERITVDQWKAVCEYLRRNLGIGAIKWHFV